MPGKVINIRSGEHYDVYIGRGSIWGNPFVLGRDGDREAVIQKYTEWILTRKDILIHLSKLNDKVLGCYCKPELCHGDVLIQLLEQYKGFISRLDSQFTYLAKNVALDPMGKFMRNMSKIYKETGKLEIHHRRKLFMR